MDVFYYWKNVKEDIYTNRIGWFRSSREKLAEFQDGSPDYLWVFKTPKGLKGQVQLLARLKWVDAPVVPVTRKPGESYVFYDPSNANSVRFIGSGDAAGVMLLAPGSGGISLQSFTVTFRGKMGNRHCAAQWYGS